MNVQKLSAIKTPKLNILVYAPPGHGKTHFMGTSVQSEKLLILSAESGLLSLRKLLEEARVKLKNPKLEIDFFPITKFEDIEEAYLYLKNKNDAKYTCVGMDSITEIQKVCMDKILREEEIEKARIQDWGTLNNRMVSMIRAFRDLDLHYIVTALAGSERDEETGSFVTKPMVQGKLADTLAGYFDEVFYLHSVEVKGADGAPVTKRWLQTQGNAKYQAKDRSGLLPRECPANFAWVNEKIMQVKVEEKTKQPEAAKPTATEEKANEISV